MKIAEHPWETLNDKPYCEPTKRMDFVLLFDVKNGNPNGDPDAGNLPRMDPATRHGIVTDVCIKRKVRDYLTAVLRRPIYIQSQDPLNTLYFEAARTITEYDPDKDEETPKKDRERRKNEKKAVEPLYVELRAVDSKEFADLVKVAEETETPKQLAARPDQETNIFREWLLSVSTQVDGLDFDPERGVLRYLGEAKVIADFKKLLKQDEFDFKAFNTEIDKLADLLAKAKRGKTGSAQERPAREIVKWKMCELYDDIRLFGAVLTAGTNAGQIRGPLQLAFARSTEPILPLDAAITRCAITRASDWSRKQTEFGRKPWLSHAVYRQHGFYNPLLGEQTGTTSADLARFWESLAYMFQNSASASKGEMAMRDLVVFVHPNHWGKAPSHKLFDLTNDSQDSNGTPSLQIKGEDEKRIKDKTGIEIHRPLADIWGDL